MIFLNHTVFRAPTREDDELDAMEAQQRAPYVGWKVLVHHRETGERRRGVISKCWRRRGDPRPTRLHVVTEDLEIVRLEGNTPWRWHWLTDDVAAERRALAMQALAAVRAKGPKDEVEKWRLFAAEIARLRGTR